MLDDDGVDTQSGLKTYFIQSAQIGRVGNRHGQPVSPMIEGNHAVRGDQLAVDGIGGNVRFIENRQIEQWIAEGVRHETGEVERGNLLTGDDLFEHRALFVIRLGQQLLRLGFLEPSRLNQGAGETAERTSLWCSGHWLRVRCRLD